MIPPSLSSLLLAPALALSLVTPGLGKEPSYAPSVPKPTLSEVSYGKHERHVLDFWKANSAKPTPLVFVIHGGGWKGGSKERLDRFVDPGALLKTGISVVAINYRLMKHAAGVTPPVKAPMEDAARALQFVRSKAKEWTPNSRYGGHAFGEPSFARFLAAREQLLPWIKEYSPYALVSADDPPAALFFKNAPGLGKPQGDPTHSANFGVKLREHCNTLGVKCVLVHGETKDPAFPDPTSDLIRTLK